MKMVCRAVWATAWLAICLALLPQLWGIPVEESPQTQEEPSSQDRKLLGSSVVTSVSVIMDHGNGTKTYFTDSEPPSIARPEVVGTPGTLMAPDRYEFYSFGKDGELVKKLMSLEEIRGLIAGGDELASGEEGLPIYYHEPLIQAGEPEGVSKVLESVQNVLKGELQAASNHDKIDVPSIPDDSWTMLLSGLMNTDLDFKEPLVTKLPNKISTRPHSTKTPTTVTSDGKYGLEQVQLTVTTHRTVTARPAGQFVKNTTPANKTARPNINQGTRPTSRPSSLPPQKLPVSSKRPLSTVKYSAHYTTLPPNLTSKKPQPTKYTNPVKKQPLPTKKTDFINVTRNPITTARTTTKETLGTAQVTQKTRPSGIPTIIHYLPIQSIGPSHTIQPNRTSYFPEYTSPRPSTTKLPYNKLSTKDSVTSMSSFSSSTLYPKISSTQNLPTYKTTTKGPTYKTTTKAPTYKTTTNAPTSQFLLATQKPTTTQKVFQEISSIKKVSTTQKPLISQNITTMKATTMGQFSTTKVSKVNSSLPNQNVTTVSKLSVTTKPQTFHPVKEMPSTISLMIQTTPTPQTSPSESINKLITTTEQLLTTTRRKNATLSISTTHKPIGSNESEGSLPSAEKLVDLNNNLKGQSSELHSAQIKISTTDNPQYTTRIKLVTSPLPVNNSITHGIETVTTGTVPPVTIFTTTPKFGFSAETSTTDINTSPGLSSTTTEFPDFVSKTDSSVTTSKESEIKNLSNTTWSQIEVSISTPFKTHENLTSTIKPEITQKTTVSVDEITTWKPHLTSAVVTENEIKNKITTTEASPDTNTKEMLLHEIPVKIYESLKKPEMNVFEALSNMPTAIQDRSATTESITDAIIINDYSVSTTISDVNDTLQITTTEELLGDENREQMNDSDFLTTTTPASITVTTTNTEENITNKFQTTLDVEQNLETTTIFGPTMPYKDQVLEEGISAVTNILLNNEQIDRMGNSGEAAHIFTTSENETPSTTENDLTSTTEVILNEAESIVHNNVKSETRTGENLVAVVTQKSVTENYIDELKKKTEVKKETKPIVPSKVSKLNPDSTDETGKNSTLKTDNTTTTSKPEFIQEKVKLQEVVKPNRYTLKKPGFPSTENLQPPPAIDLHPAPYESMGLEASTAFLSEDVRRFAELCNELAFRLWTSLTGKGQISSRSLVLSPFAATSILAMVFLGARGSTSGQMNDILRLDDMVTFNPHQVLQNVTDSVLNSKNHGVATAAFARQLYSDKSKGKILDFYKERAQQYYQGHVEEINFHMIGDIIRRRSNLLIKRQTLGKVPEYLRGSSLNMRPPLAAFSANIFQTDCEDGSTEGRDGEMYFVVRPSTRQRRLVPVPAVVWRSGFLAGYEPSLDATSICLGADSAVSTILILPGQQGQVAPGDGLARLEQRLIETSYRRGGWSRLLRSLLPRPGLELQVPRFSHRSVLNVTSSLQRMGLKDLFDSKADLRGLNGLSNDLHLSDMVQVNTFSTCGEETIGARHHIETYPASPQRMGRVDPEYYPPRDYENAFGDVPLALRPRQARLPDTPRLRFDRPFLYMVRHNPSGMILHMGRFNPRLLP